MKKKTKKGIYIYIESMIYFVKRQSFAVQTGYYSYENISLPNYFVKKNKIKKFKGGMVHSSRSFISVDESIRSTFHKKTITNTFSN